MTKNTFTNPRSAYWIVIAAASLAFTTHAVEGARLMKESPKTSIKPQVVASPSTLQSRALDPQMTAAYRDGLYVGKLVAQRGEQRQAPVGRWATQMDRDTFQAGYEQANLEIAEATGNN